MRVLPRQAGTLNASGPTGYRALGDTLTFLSIEQDEEADEQAEWASKLVHPDDTCLQPRGVWAPRCSSLATQLISAT